MLQNLNYNDILHRLKNCSLGQREAEHEIVDAPAIKQQWSHALGAQYESFYFTNYSSPQQTYFTLHIDSIKILLTQNFTDGYLKSYTYDFNTGELTANNTRLEDKLITFFEKIEQILASTSTGKTQAYALEKRLR